MSGWVVVGVEFGDEACGRKTTKYAIVLARTTFRSTRLHSSHMKILLLKY